ncbi:PrsW family glutamic-type intramembrane protease [Tengunoibacter tsumagoiensis]|uniref:FHA domain-containing protein n=1 Tax=Tengunoibacter tsumagoiensis TaxID=2014871 RepID=A0A402A2G7_9CHLR|nr:PrsW family glutamic-type intramembrane protease [Tengunoibacter tsumagoiensis]GCE13337.1 hypothetical protein KTT_31960 [Tengunoibacter tsumagoiensis]
MSVSDNFGVLRIVRVRAANTARKTSEKQTVEWLPEERLVHLLTQRETIIGRALSSDLVLLDPTVSREHARLVLDELGWRVYNLTSQNIVRVNGRTVPMGESLPLQPQDCFVLGGTTLQLIAPSQGDLDDVSSLACPPQTDGSPVEDHLIKLKQWQDQESSISVLPNEATVLAGIDTDIISEEEDSGGVPEGFLSAGITMQFALPRLLRGKVRWWVFGVVVAFLIVGAVIAIILHNMTDLMALTQDGPVSILSALTIPLIPAIGIGLLVNCIDRFEREPWFLRLGAFIWGAIIIPPALFIEQQLDTAFVGIAGPDSGALAHALFQGLRAGVTEESVKGFGLLLLFFLIRDEFDNITDGIVYGALIGAGFAMVENFYYFVQSPKLILFLFVGRIVLGWLCHSTFTVCFGIALGYVRHTRLRWKHIAIPLVGFLAAIGLHTIFDFINQFANDLATASPDNATIMLISTIAVIANYIPPFCTQIVILYFLLKSLSHEVYILREFLASEVSRGIITVDEYALLQHSFVRTQEERRVLRRYGWKQWLRVKELYQTEIGLAFRKWHVSMGDKPKFGYIQPEDAYRQRIKRLRQEIVVCEQAKKGEESSP